jgi:ATP-binding cassette subfamily B protein
MLQMGLLLFVGAAWVGDGRITVGTLFAFLTYLAMILWPLKALGRVLTDASKAVVALERINDILQEREEGSAHHYPVRPAAPSAGRLDVEHVSFGYAPHYPVLHDISFSVAPGETLALVGPPGSGKSTIIRLLLRLYDYDHGSIRMDGLELRTLDRQYVRQQFGAVLQDPFLYSKTIRENLLVGRLDATGTDLDDAVQRGAIDTDIQSFPAGAETLVGERGVTLSGGQRQRLALARALLHDPEVLLLDEPAESLDTVTADALTADLLDVTHGRTTLLVTHRLHGLEHLDEIIVLEDGHVTQRGTHDELISTPGYYRDLWHSEALTTTHP